MPSGITMTVWQVQIKDTDGTPLWRYAEPDTAVMVAMMVERSLDRAGHVRLVDVTVPCSIKFRRRRRNALQQRGATPNRLRHAAKAIDRLVETAGLFGKFEKQRLEVTQQATPADRIEMYDQAAVDHEHEWRHHDAQSWKKARAMLRSAPAELQALILFKWNGGPYPTDAGNFASFVRTRLREAGLTD
jgi:hypothetical protein